MNVCVSLQAAQQRVNELNSRYEILPKKQNTFFFLAVLPKQKYHTLQEMYNRIQSSHEQSSTVPKFPSKVVLCSSSVVSDSVTPWTIVRYIYIYIVHYMYTGSSVHGIFQARILEWVATSFFSHPELLDIQRTKMTFLTYSLLYWENIINIDQSWGDSDIRTIRHRF